MVDDDDEEEEREQQRVLECEMPEVEQPRLIICLPAFAFARLHAQAGGASGSGGGDGPGAGGPPAHLWTPECQRRGDRARVGGARDIGFMPCGDNECGQCHQDSGPLAQGNLDSEKEEQDEEEEPNNLQKGQRKRQKAVLPWWTNPDGGPAITQCTGDLLSELLVIFGRRKRLQLEGMLSSLDSISGAIGLSSENNMHTVVARLGHQSQALKIQELQYMLTLVQLALNVDRYLALCLYCSFFFLTLSCSLKAKAALKHQCKMSYEKMATLYAGKTPVNTFKDWVSWGKHLLFLCAAGVSHAPFGSKK